jgi:hypothetical protein
MIVNVGKRINVEIRGFRFSCDCATPGAVKVTSDRGEAITLPGNEQEALAFVAAYLRTVREPIDYVSSQSEAPNGPPPFALTSVEGHCFVSRQGAWAPCKYCGLSWERRAETGCMSPRSP